ncbi:hypothetical protein FACS1894208_05330 [Clostridia bacterium]|nr:hypothetical protein FACS1894208_05330 [Clostridia bacterium]
MNNKMGLPLIHGTCNWWDTENVKETHIAGGAYGGLRRYAECSRKHKPVECNSKGCKYWSPYCEEDTDK